jgi:hypothetical protein
MMLAALCTGATLQPVRAAPAAATVPTATAARVAETEVLARERAWLDAVEQNNADVIAEILADDFVLTIPDGRTVTKADVVARRRKPRAPNVRHRLTTSGVVAHLGARRRDLARAELADDPSGAQALNASGGRCVAPARRAGDCRTKSMRCLGNLRAVRRDGRSTYDAGMESTHFLVRRDRLTAHPLVTEPRGELATDTAELLDHTCEKLQRSRSRRDLVKPRSPGHCRMRSRRRTANQVRA